MILIALAHEGFFPNVKLTVLSCVLAPLALRAKGLIQLELLGNVLVPRMCLLFEEVTLKSSSYCDVLHML
jgi:hypothetical protein